MNPKLPWRKQYQYNCNFFKTIDTADKAYWFGFVLADGCIVESRSPSLVVNLQLADKSHLESFKEALCSDHSVRLRLNKSRGTISARLAIHSSILVDDLIKLGCISRKSTVDTVVSNIEQSLFCHFARGYFDGNGTIGFYERRGRKRMDGSPVYEPSWACAGSLSVLKYLKNNIQSDLPWFSPPIQSLPGCHRISISNSKHISLLFEYFYSCGGTCLPRKFHKWEAGNRLISAN